MARRTTLAPRLLPLLLRVPALRTAAFRTLAELTIHYRRSRIVEEGPAGLRGGPRAGDRLPAGPALVGGEERPLYEVVGAPGFHLLLCGSPDEWDRAELRELEERYAGVLAIHHLPGGEAWGRLGLHPGQRAQYLVRPDTYVSYRAAGGDLTGLRGHLRRWLPAGPATP